VIEPTESEPKEEPDAFCDAMIAIAREAAKRPELAKTAPSSAYRRARQEKAL